MFLEQILGLDLVVFGLDASVVVAVGTGTLHDSIQIFLCLYDSC
jgi:hypothetical protein